MWSVECGVWSVECGAFGVWSMECVVWSVVCGVWSVVALELHVRVDHLGCGAHQPCLANYLYLRID